MPESRMSRLSNQYHDWARNHPTAAGDFRTAIEDLLNDAGIIFDRVSTRVKTWPSL
ncbi:MAG: GTP pyrophosphokinase family protein, partial [Corynebacterium sp.]|nr:GTP pyrophosphokinase family protein [Corynebacterium sp.]